MDAGWRPPPRCRTCVRPLSACSDTARGAGPWPFTVRQSRESGRQLDIRFPADMICRKVDPAWHVGLGVSPVRRHGRSHAAAAPEARRRTAPVTPGMAGVMPRQRRGHAAAWPESCASVAGVMPRQRRGHAAASHKSTRHGRSHAAAPRVSCRGVAGVTPRRTDRPRTRRSRETVPGSPSGCLPRANRRRSARRRRVGSATAPPPARFPRQLPSPPAARAG
jgi:hypothetical protein